MEGNSTTKERRTQFSMKVNNIDLKTLREHRGMAITGGAFVEIPAI
jgi:hypothetical protein